MEMQNKIHKIGVLTSGGDSPGMNAAVRSVVRTALNFGMEVVGIKRGYNGLIRDDTVELTSRTAADVMQRGNKLRNG